MSFFIPYLTAAQDVMDKIEAQALKKRRRCMSAHMKKKSNEHLGLRERYEAKIRMRESGVLLNDRKRGSLVEIGRADASKILV